MKITPGVEQCLASRNFEKLKDEVVDTLEIYPMEDREHLGYFLSIFAEAGSDEMVRFILDTYIHIPRRMKHAAPPEYKKLILM